MADSIFGIVGSGFTLLAADCSAVRSILAYKHDEDKIRPLDSHKLFAAAGPQADCVQFCELVQRNVALNEFRSGLRASTHSATSYVRNELHSALRQNPFQVNLLIAGFDSSAPGSSISGYKSASASSASSSAAAGSNAAAAGTAAASAPLSAMEAATRSVTAQGSASLYFLDYLGSSQKMNFAAHGYASYFIFSTLDRHWRAGMSEAQALELVKLCVKELKTRFLMHQPNWKVKVCDANGTREVAFDASAL